MEISLFEYSTVRPLSAFGLTHPFWDINMATLIWTWVAMGLLFSFILIGKKLLRERLGVIVLIMERAIQFFCDLCTESFGYFKYEYFAFIAALFFFTFACNLTGLIPFLEESTTDPNTTFALALSSFFYVQYQKVIAHGVKGYVAEYFEPMFLMFPLHVVGELAKVLSMAFRLFGNILGGSIILLLAVQFAANYKEAFMLMALILLPTYFILNKYIDLSFYPFINIIFKILLGFLFLLPGIHVLFGLFEGFIQAFVISMLTITYLSVGVSDAKSH